MPNFVFRLAGRDLAVGLGVDIRVDAQRHAGRPAGLARKCVQKLKLGLGFHVEAADIVLERGGDLVRRLADAGKDDAVACNARRQRPAQFALGDDVHAGAEIGQGLQDCLVGIGLDRIAQQMIGAREGLRVDPVVAFERRGRIAIERRADLVRDGAQVGVFGMEAAVAVGEVMHWRGIS